MTEFISTCSMPLAIVFLIAGFFFLVKGADVFVEGSSSIAKRFHVPAIIIGLTIVGGVIAFLYYRTGNTVLAAGNVEIADDEEVL